MEKEIQTIIKTILDFLELPYINVSIEELLGNPLFKIETNESDQIIGTHGDRIRALNHIIKKMAQQKGFDERFMIDVNDYRTKKITEIQDAAKLLADRALSLKYDVEMQPMNAYERMVVHAFLADTEHIETSSIGEDRERRVVIKYVQ